MRSTKSAFLPMALSLLVTFCLSPQRCDLPVFQMSGETSRPDSSRWLLPSGIRAHRARVPSNCDVLFLTLFTHRGGLCLVEFVSQLHRLLLQIVTRGTVLRHALACVGALVSQRVVVSVHCCPVSDGLTSATPIFWFSSSCAWSCST